MPTHSETKILKYQPEQMFELVADVNSYPQFLPWCSAARIHSRSFIENNEVLEADLVISFNTSSILLESIILEKPTISLITDDWAKENEIIKMNGVMSIDNIQNVESDISKIISNNEYNLELKSSSKQFLENYLSNHGTASEQLVKILKKL